MSYLLQDRLDLVPIGRRRHDDAARPHHRLAEEGRDRIRPFLLDQRVELLGPARRKGFLALAGRAVLVEMRRARVQDVRQRQVERAVVVGQAREARRRNGDAVIGAHAADDLLALGLAERIGAIGDQLEDGVVRLRAGIGEEHLAHRHRRERDQLLGEVDRGPVRFGREGVIERQRLHLLVRGLDQPLLVEAEPDAPQARHRLEIALARRIEHVGPLAALDHQRTCLLMRARVGVGVELIGHIAGFLRIGQHGHLRGSLKSSRRRRGSRLHWLSVYLAIAARAKLATPIRRQQALSSDAQSRTQDSAQAAPSSFPSSSAAASLTSTSAIDSR